MRMFLQISTKPVRNFGTHKKYKMKKLGKKQMGGATKTKTPSVDRSLASKIKTESSSLAKKEAPEYKKTSIKTVTKDSVKSPIRYQKGGQTSQAVAKKIVKGVKSDVKTAINTPYNVMKSVDDTLEKRYPNYTKPGGIYDSFKKGVKSIFQNGGTVKPAAKKPAVKKATPPRSTMDMIRGSKKSDYTGTVTQAAKTGGSVKKYMTGGVVNPNAAVQASKVAKGRPAKSAEPKSAAKKATGRVGGISKEPKTAVPKAKYGMVMRKK